MIVVHNDGPRIVSSTYWGSEYDRKGYAYLSVNAGAFRLLLPSGGVPGGRLADLKCDLCVVSRGPWPARGKPDALELLFDDGSRSPYHLTLSPGQWDVTPSPEDAVRDDLRMLVYTHVGQKPPLPSWDLPAAYRHVDRLPCLRPWGGA